MWRGEFYQVSSSSAKPVKELKIKVIRQNLRHACARVLNLLKSDIQNGKIVVHMNFKLACNTIRNYKSHWQYLFQTGSEYASFMFSSKQQQLLYYYIHLMAFFQDDLGKPAAER